MSAIALKWVSTIKVGNQTAKQLLLFYASHNFNTDDYVFKNSTLANQLEVTERAIRNAHKLLLEQELIKKQLRFNENGRQTTNSIMLNIPPEFVDNFFGEEERSAPLGRNVVLGEEERSAPLLNNKALNNKSNNKESALSDNFLPNEETKQIAKERGVDIDSSLKIFKIKKKDKKSTNWQDEFKIWVLNEKNTNKTTSSAPPKNEIRSTVPEYESDNDYQPAKPEVAQKYLGDIMKKIKCSQGSRHDDRLGISTRN